MIKKLLQASKLITSNITSFEAKWYKKNIEKIMQVTNGNKKIYNLSNNDKREKHISLITEIKFLRTLMNSFAL